MLAALGLNACGAAVAQGPMLPPGPPETATERASIPLERSSEPRLFITHRDFSKVSLSEYRLPLHRRERPSVSRRGVSEPIPIAANGRELFVASFNTDKLYAYSLPLRPHSKRSSIEPGVGDPGGLALDGGYLYVSGAARSGDNEVLEYKLPLTKGEAPSAHLKGFPIVDELGVTAAQHTLFVASTTRGTVAAYRLPLTDDEPPEYTIATLPQDDATTSVAVDRAAQHLYVGFSSRPYVYEYHLPYRGEMPRILTLRGGQLANPLALAVGHAHLFAATTGGAVLSYPLPLTRASHPDAHVLVAGAAAGVAVGE